jgi:hypothetical protein
MKDFLLFFDAQKFLVVCDLDSLLYQLCEKKRMKLRNFSRIEENSAPFLWMIGDIILF